MPAIIEFPTLAPRAVEQFGAVLANAPERRHFAEYLTGLLVTEKKTVSGINAEFPRPQLVPDPGKALISYVRARDGGSTGK